MISWPTISKLTAHAVGLIRRGSACRDGDYRHPPALAMVLAGLTRLARRDKGRFVHTRHHLTCEMSALSATFFSSHAITASSVSISLTVREMLSVFSLHRMK